MLQDHLGAYPKKLGQLVAAFGHEDALRADLQRYYGIDLDHAMAGEHSAGHVAALVAFLPSDANLRRAADGDAAWTLEATLMASILNSLNLLIWAMSDQRKRGPKPQLVGPSYMSATKSTVPARTMTIDELMEELGKPRR